MADRRGRIVLILGGARSGKSSFALELAGKRKGNKVYIATAQALDGEMHDRIAQHRIERGKSWDTIEEPLLLADVMRSAPGRYDVVLLDCLTLWVSNLLCGGADAESAFDDFLGALQHPDNRALTCIVSNEVGQGIVPDNALSRNFRDLAGFLNQRVARAADEVYLVTAGIPLKIKP